MGVTGLVHDLSMRFKVVGWMNTKLIQTYACTYLNTFSGSVQWLESVLLKKWSHLKIRPNMLKTISVIHGCFCMDKKKIQFQ